jgi:hypothetical protein
MLTPSTQVTLALVRAAPEQAQRHGLEVFHDVAGAGKTPEPRALEAMMRLQVGKAHLRPLPLMARSQERLVFILRRAMPRASFGVAL